MYFSRSSFVVRTRQQLLMIGTGEPMRDRCPPQDLCTYRKIRLVATRSLDFTRVYVKTPVPCLVVFAAEQMEQVLGAIAGKHPDLTSSTPGLDEYIVEAMSDGCPGDVERHSSGFCMPKAGTTVSSSSETPKGAAPRDYYDVSARGARMGRTSSFITAVWCEMLRAYTVRSAGYISRTVGTRGLCRCAFDSWVGGATSRLFRTCGQSGSASAPVDKQASWSAVAGGFA